MARARKANTPPTHPSVYVGLALASVGLLLAMYAYTGTRVYDITFAFVALAGAALALGGILTAAWGRAILAQRAARARRGLSTARGKPAPKEDKAEEAAPAPPPAQPPTVAAPAEKKRFSFSFPKRSATGNGAADEPAAAEKPARKTLSFRRAKREPQPEEPASMPVVAERERLVLQCPSCEKEFTDEGVRPFEATCPGCGFSADV